MSSPRQSYFPASPSRACTYRPNEYNNWREQPEILTLRELCQHYIATPHVPNLRQTVLVVNKLGDGWLRVDNALASDATDGYLDKGCMFLGVSYNFYYRPSPDDHWTLDNGVVLLQYYYRERALFTEKYWAGTWAGIRWGFKDEGP